MKKVKIKQWIPAVFPEGATSANQTTTHRPLKGTGCWEEGYSGSGMFHQWANAYEEFEAGPGNYTVALVELPNGEIKEVLPTHLKFI